MNIQEVLNSEAYSSGDEDVVVSKKGSNIEIEQNNVHSY